jgi:hypothetical protein
LFLLLDYMHLVSTLLLTDARTLERRKVFLLGTYGNELLVHFLEKGAGSTFGHAGEGSMHESNGETGETISTGSTFGKQGQLSHL